MPIPEIAKNTFDQGTFSLNLPIGLSVYGPMLVDSAPNGTFESQTLCGILASRTLVGSGVPIVVTWYFIEYGDELIALAIHDPEMLEPLHEVIQSIEFK